MSSRVGDLANHFQSSADQPLPSLAIGVTIGTCALAAAAGYLIYAKYVRGEAEYYLPNRLFDGLCRTHGLVRRERRLLLQIAMELEMKQSALLFTNPAFLRSAQRKLDKTLTPQIKQLHRKLFD